MTVLPKKLSEEFLESMSTRARYILKRSGEKIPGCPETKPVDRETLKTAENYARGVLTFDRHGVAAKLSKDVLLLVHNVDSLMAEIYPVFEMIDQVLFRENGTLEVKDGVWRLYDTAGYLLSEGRTLREFLTDHVTRYGKNVSVPFDPRFYDNFKLPKDENKNPED